MLKSTTILFQSLFYKSGKIYYEKLFLGMIFEQIALYKFIIFLLYCMNEKCQRTPNIENFICYEVK